MVASDVGSRRGFVHSGETGLLYRTGDVNQLATAIQRLGSSPELAEKMGRAGWEMLRKRHRPEENYQRLVSLYENLVAHSKTRNHGIAVATDNKRWQFALPTAASSNPNPIALGSSGSCG